MSEKVFGKTVAQRSGLVDLALPTVEAEMTPFGVIAARFPCRFDLRRGGAAHFRDLSAPGAAGEENDGRSGDDREPTLEADELRCHGVASVQSLPPVASLDAASCAHLRSV